MSLYERVLGEAAATAAAGFAALSSDEKRALARAWDAWRNKPSWEKRGQNAWYDCPRVKAVLGLSPGDKVPRFIKRLKRKDLSESKQGGAAASKKLSGTWGHPRRHGKKAASKKRRQQGKRIDEGKAASSSQISYAQHLAKQQKLRSPTADEIAAMDDVTISKLIDGLKKKRGEPVFYGNGKFKGWVKKGELWPKGKKESLGEAAWGMFTGGAAPLDVPYHVGGDWKEGAAQLLRRELAKLKGMERARLALLADALERRDLKAAKRFYKKLSKAARNRYVTVAAREKLSESLEEYGGIGGRIAGGRHPYRVPPSNTIPPANTIVTRKDMTPELLAKRQRELEQRAETRERMRQLAIEGKRRPLKTLSS